MRTLYCATIDADCFTARLALAVLGRSYEPVAVDAYPGLDPASQEVLALGPLPVLRVDDALYAGLRPVLEHLFGAPIEDPWFAFAERDLRPLRDLRERSFAGRPASADELAAVRQKLLTLEDALTLNRLHGRRWFHGDEFGPADLALYPSVALSRDVGLEHDELPALRHWLRDVRALAPSVPMPGILDPL